MAAAAQLRCERLAELVDVPGGVAPPEDVVGGRQWSDQLLMAAALVEGARNADAPGGEVLVRARVHAGSRASERGHEFASFCAVHRFGEGHVHVPAARGREVLYVAQAARGQQGAQPLGVGIDDSLGGLRGVQVQA
ncbi:hypothetical protein GCM10009849_05180 [Sinomonas flava]|uniref:Uncharacterized protein n=1 Tax=Sinomonas flava TaxID=496857 RepID=A0ABN3BKZ2_9MICC